MKSDGVGFTWLKAILTGAIVLSAVFIVKAQKPSFKPKLGLHIDDNINGFWEYLPRDYSTDVSVKYPLLISFHGFGDSGDTPDQATLDKVVNAGLPKLIHQGNFPETFTVGGNSYRFIVLCPQIKNGLVDQSSSVDPATVEALITYAKNNYRIDVNRMYMCGLSMGGGITWDYAASSKQAAGQLAAVAIAAGASDLTAQGADNIAALNVPVLVTHNTVDDVISVSRTINNIARLNNRATPMNPLPVAVYWNTPGITGSGQDKHNVWSRTFEDMQPSGTLGGNLIDTIGINIYEWMLGYKRNLSALPVTLESVTLRKVNNAVLVQWVTAKEVNVKQFIVEKSRDGSVWSAVASLSPSARDSATNNYSFTDNAPYPGVCYYRIRVIYSEGANTFSPVKQIGTGNASAPVNIYPNPFTDRLSLNFSSSGTSGNLLIRLLNAAGAMVKEMQVALPVSGDVAVPGLQSLASGVYYITVENSRGERIQKKKVMKR